MPLTDRDMDGGMIMDETGNYIPVSKVRQEIKQNGFGSVDYRNTINSDGSTNRAGTNKAVSGGAVTPLHTAYGDTAPRVEVADKPSDLSSVNAEIENKQKQATVDLGDKIKALESDWTKRMEELNNTKFVDQKEADDRVRYAERVGRGMYQRYKEGEFGDPDSDDPKERKRAKRQFGTMLANHIGTSMQNIGEFLATNHSSDKQSDFDKINNSDLDAALERRKVADNVSLESYLDNAEYTKEQKREMMKTHDALMENEELRPIVNRLNSAEQAQLFALDAEFGNMLVKHPELAPLVVKAKKSGDTDFIKQQLAERSAYDFSVALMERGVDVSAEQAKALADVQLMTNEQIGERMKDPQFKALITMVAPYIQYTAGNTTLSQGLKHAQSIVGMGTDIVNTALDVATGGASGTAEALLKAAARAGGKQ